MEIDGLATFADSRNLDRFHLLGYSGGGYVSLAFAGAHPGRLLSLALFEPASVPGKLSPEEEQFDSRLSAAVHGLQGADFIRAFMPTQLRPGARRPPPPAGPPPPRIPNRPARTGA